MRDFVPNAEAAAFRSRIADVQTIQTSARSQDDPERIAFSEYHASGSVSGAFMVRRAGGNISFAGVSSINRWNIEKPFASGPDNVKFDAVTTGGFSGFEAVLGQASTGDLSFTTPFGSGRIPIDAIGLDDVIFEAGGFGRQVRFTRLPDLNLGSTFEGSLRVPLHYGQDNALYCRVTFEDGSVAWTSPIYLIKSDGRSAG